jgi:hypothetical protein
MKRRKE